MNHDDPPPFTLFPDLGQIIAVQPDVEACIQTVMQLLHEQGRIAPVWLARAVDGQLTWIAAVGAAAPPIDHLPDEWRRAAPGTVLQYTRSAGGGAIWAMPLVMAGQLTGVLAGPWPLHAEPALLRQIQPLLTLLLAADAAAADTVRQQQRLRVLLEGMQALAGSLDVATVLATTVRQLARTLEVDRCVLFTYDAAQGRLDMLAVHDERGGDYTTTVPNLRLADYQQIRRVIETSTAVAVADAQGPEVDPETRAACRKLGIRSFLFVPLRYDGQTLGVVGLDEIRRQRVFDEREIAFCRGLAGQAAAALWYAQIFERMEREQAGLREANARQQGLLELVRQLSTPVVPVLEDIVVLPLIGVIDAQRAQRIMETLLTVIERDRARIVIIDITGVSVVDTHVAQHLLRTVQAASLLGAEGVLVGIRPEVAETIVRLGIALDGVATAPDLRRGIEYALRRLGRRITITASR